MSSFTAQAVSHFDSAVSSPGSPPFYDGVDPNLPWWERVNQPFVAFAAPADPPREQAEAEDQAALDAIMASYGLAPASTRRPMQPNSVVRSGAVPAPSTAQFAAPPAGRVLYRGVWLDSGLPAGAVVASASDSYSSNRAVGGR